MTIVSQGSARNMDQLQVLIKALWWRQPLHLAASVRSGPARRPRQLISFAGSLLDGNHH
jgi:hypothetical protein